MNLSTVVTTFVGAAAAWRGTAADAADVAPTSRPSPSHIANSTLPPALEQLLVNGFESCLDRMTKNPRIFGAQTQTGRDALCLVDSAVFAGLKYAFSAPLSEMGIIREGIYRRTESLSTNPLSGGGIDNAGHSGAKLMAINFRDYRDSGTSSYVRNRSLLVARLEAEIPPSERGSMEAARRAAGVGAKAREGLMTQLARSEVAERVELAILRSVGSPTSMSLEQREDLREDLKLKQFGDTSIKSRMLKDALELLVERHTQQHRDHDQPVTP